MSGWRAAERMMRRLHLPALAAALALAAAAPSPAAGHDLWLEVSDFTPAAGEAVTVDVRVGDAFPGEALPWRPAATVRFAVVDGAGERPVEPRAATPAATFAAPPGDHAVVFRSGEARIELAAEKFAAYLAEEGLDAVAARRAAAGAAELPGRELYSRSVKALLRGGGAANGRSVHTRPAGLDLDLVPAVSPYDLGVGDELELTLLWRGAPLAGARVDAVARETPEALYSRRTDERGVVRLPLTAPGFWRIAVVHMTEADGGEADWRSVWSTLTFEIDD